MTTKSGITYKINGQTAQQPTDHSECVNGGISRKFTPSIRFVTVSPNTMDESTFTAKPAGEACVQCDAGGTTYNYYHMLMAR